MTDAVDLCSGRPVEEHAPGAVLIRAGSSTDRLLVLLSGEVAIRRDGVDITRVSAPGAFLGEMSVLLGTSTSADVVAVSPVRVHVIEDASRVLAEDAALAVEVGRVLARRVAAMTTYLVDLQRQYEGTGGHLALMDQVLSELMAAAPRRVEIGSERGDQPPY